MLETDRLILRPFAAGDIEAFGRINADPAVMRYFPAPYTVQETQAMMQRCAERWINDGYAFSAMIRKSDGLLIGMNGLSLFRGETAFAPRTEVGWRLTPSAWGQGYASEAAHAWIKHGFTVLNLPFIVAFAPAPNLPSQRVMQRLGMVRAAELDFAHPAIPDGSPLKSMVVYRISKDHTHGDWPQWHGGR